MQVNRYEVFMSHNVTSGSEIKSDIAFFMRPLKYFIFT